VLLVLWDGCGSVGGLTVAQAAACGENIGPVGGGFASCGSAGPLVGGLVETVAYWVCPELVRPLYSQLMDTAAALDAQDGVELEMRHPQMWEWRGGC